MALLAVLHPVPAPTAEAQSSRRERLPDPSTAVIIDAISQKLVNGWLQNRNQTFMPLTLNFRILSAEQRDLVVSLLAALLQIGRPALDIGPATAPLKSWLARLGAEPATAATLDAAIADPRPLGPLLDQVQSLDMTMYAYVAALAASDPRFPASTLLCDVIAARFELSSAAIRSAARRYRR